SLVICLLLLTGEMTPPRGSSYKAQIRLPVDLFTRDGALLRKGRFDVEVRFQKERYVLLFLEKDKVVAVVNGQPSELEESKESSHTDPLVGTTLLWPINADDKVKDDNSKGPQYLPGLSWETTLRIYRSSDHGDNEIFLIFQKLAKPNPAR